MFVAGIDIGSLSSKALILENSKIMGWSLTLTGPSSHESAGNVFNLALKERGLSLADISYIVATGYGRVNVPFAQATITEISCHARGSNWLFPEVRTVLDMGGQDCKAIRCDELGRVQNFALNDKCAAGTGRYLERVAAALELRLEEIGALSLQPVEGALPVSDFCAVFAERDVINLARGGKHVNDILAGACEAVVSRVLGLLNRVGVEEAFCVSGGIAKNVGVVRRLEKQLGLKALIAPEPQIVGALGAALFAADKVHYSTQPRPAEIQHL
jgi:predicted CoA-substrate-specific enzyme activase